MVHADPLFDCSLTDCRRAARHYAWLCVSAAVVAAVIMPLVAASMPWLTGALYPLVGAVLARLPGPVLPALIFTGAAITMAVGVRAIHHWSAQREAWENFARDQRALSRVRQAEKTGLARGLIKAQKRWVKRRHRHGLPVLPLPREWEFLPASLHGEATEIERLRARNQQVHRRWQQKNWPERAPTIAALRYERAR